MKKMIKAASKLDTLIEGGICVDEEMGTRCNKNCRQR